MSKIIRLQAENVKRLEAVEITPDKNIVIIGGKNGAGKSSVLDAIVMAFCGKDKIPSEPLRKGAKKGKIVVDIGDLVLTRTFTEGDSKLTVANKDGARYNGPQSILDALYANLAFDPLAFMRMKPKEQAETLRTLAGVDFKALDEERAQCYERRRDLNRDVERLTKVLESSVSYPDAPKELQDAAGLNAQLSKVNATNNANESRRQGLKTLVGRGAAARQSEDKAKAEVERLKAELIRAEEALRDASKAVSDLRNEYEAESKAIADLKDVDTAPILEKLASLEEINSKVRANIEKAETAKELAEFQGFANKEDSRIKEIDAEKARLLSESNLPVDGLAFDENGVSFNGIPIDQASGAEQLRISVAIAAAMNPKLRVMLCKDGALLDSDSLAMLADYAEKNDLQVWLEDCRAGAEATVIIADGHVAEEVE